MPLRYANERVFERSPLAAWSFSFADRVPIAPRGHQEALHASFEVSRLPGHGQGSHQSRVGIRDAQVGAGPREPVAGGQDRDLRRWEYDAGEVDVSGEEGMPGPDSDLLRRIMLALETLATVDPDESRPTKQRGLPRSAVKPK
jgi:hypothetical protein